jgi:hypothetical protein
MRLLLLLAHRHPGVGDDDVRSGDGFLGVGEEGDRAARLGGPRLGVGDHGIQGRELDG